MPKILGYIAYEGPSEIDGRPIVVIVNKLSGSDNAKTGADLVQTFIIRADIAPTDALKTGDDVSICGQCAHRPLLASETDDAPCYVNVGRSVRSVYEAYKRGRYVKIKPGHLRRILAGRKKSAWAPMGTRPPRRWPYGRKITADAAGIVGYSHQWQAVHFDHAAWAPLVMASADTIDEAAQANLFGMRVFRVSVGIDRQASETTCPASAEGGKKATCDTCMLCGGTSKQARDIVIADHAVGHARRVIKLQVAA